MVLPAKMGDIAKAAFMKERGHLGGSLALSLVVFEKTCDMLALLCFCAAGLFLYPTKDSFFWLMTAVISLSLVAGGALIASTRFAAILFSAGRVLLALAPLAILAGLVPLTFAGVGTRDAALILLFRPYFDSATGAALGLLCTARYLLPAIGGLPFLHRYLDAMQGQKLKSSSAPQSATLPP
jgi:uncharacterized membrane protein YbhN (UPF0104 family)